MQVTFQKALSFYLTGRTNLPPSAIAEENYSIKTKEEADAFETTIQEHKNEEKESVIFKNQTLNIEANLDTASGQFRQAGLGAIGSFFSAIGAGIGGKLNFPVGVGLGGLSLGIASLNLPFLKTKYKLLSFGGSLIRSPLRILDSIFSLVGEHGSKFFIPSLIASALSFFSLSRILRDKDNKSLKLPNNTISGTLGRTAGHHFDSMLASKGIELANSHQNTSAFIASSIATSTLLLDDKIKKKEIPWNTLEGYIAQGNISFLDSLFSSIGRVFSNTLTTSKNIFLGTFGFLFGMPFIGRVLKSLNYKVPFGTFEGKTVQSIFRGPETFAFNLGNSIGNSKFGLPVSLGVIGLTGLATSSKNSKIEIERDSLTGQFQKLPLLHLMFSIVSASGLKLSKFIPAPLLLIFGPSVSFQLGEIFKKIPAKFNELKGLLVRNSVHLWETILSSAVYKTGRLVTGTQDSTTSSGSVYGEHWLTEEGQIVDSMAIGKQMKGETGEKNGNVLNVLLSSIGGIGFGFVLSKLFANKAEVKPLNKRITQAITASENFVRKPISKPVILEYSKKAA